MNNKIVVGMLGLMLAGCQTGLKNMAAGETGCMPDDIKIVVEPSFWGIERQKFYVAQCKGVDYICSYVLANESMRDLRCKKKLD